MVSKNPLVVHLYASCQYLADESTVEVYSSDGKCP